MTLKFKNVYIKETSHIVGPYEKEGPLNLYFDKAYKDFYMNEKTIEQAEVKLLKESIDILLQKVNTNYKNIDLIIGGDLLNQITSASYGVKNYNIPFLGIYSACATSVEGILIGANFIDSKKTKNAIVSVSSHNLSSEKQFRNPTEYGALKPSNATSTATGGASILLTNEKTNVRISSATIGKVCNAHIKDPFNMGAIMAVAASDTISKHLKNLNETVKDYDLILTGDLGKYGKKILKELIKKDHNIKLNNYNDCGVMLYDLKKQKQMLSGGSGPVCSALVSYSYIFNQLKNKKLKKVLLVATGALFSPTFLYQKQDILSIAHAVSLEAIN